MDERLNKALQQVIQILEEHGYRYAVIGGIALAYWNVSRFTHDIDIKLVAPDMDFVAMRTALRHAFPEPAREQGPANPLIVPVFVNEVIVDFLLALPGYEEMIVERAVKRQMGNLSISICSAEDLIIQKVVAGRAKDWPDVEALLVEQRGKLDQGYIQDWLSQFSDALDKPAIIGDYLALKEKIDHLV